MVWDMAGDRRLARPFVFSPEGTPGVFGRAFSPDGAAVAIGAGNRLTLGCGDPHPDRRRGDVAEGHEHHLGRLQPRRENARRRRRRRQGVPRRRRRAIGRRRPGACRRPGGERARRVQRGRSIARSRRLQRRGLAARRRDAGARRSAAHARRDLRAGPRLQPGRSAGRVALRERRLDLGCCQSQEGAHARDGGRGGVQRLLQP